MKFTIRMKDQQDAALHASSCLGKEVAVYINNIIRDLSDQKLASWLDTAFVHVDDQGTIQQSDGALYYDDAVHARAKGMVNFTQPTSAYNFDLLRKHRFFESYCLSYIQPVLDERFAAFFDQVDDVTFQEVDNLEVKESAVDGKYNLTFEVIVQSGAIVHLMKFGD